MIALATAPALASDKQIAFLNRLAGERDHGIPELDEVITLAANGGLPKARASRAIDMLLAMPRKATTHSDGQPVTEGFYLLNDLVYRVVTAKTTGNLYAKVLAISGGRGSWDYAAGAIRALAAAPRLNVQQAAEMGARYGVCVVCGKTLTDPESVARGIGPVCSARL